MSAEKEIRYPGWGADADFDFTHSEYAEWAADEYEAVGYPYTVDLLEIDQGAHIFKVVDPTRTLLISVWLDEGVLYHEEVSHLAEYKKYLNEEIK